MSDVTMPYEPWTGYYAFLAWQTWQDYIQVTSTSTMGGSCLVSAPAKKLTRKEKRKRDRERQESRSIAQQGFRLMTAARLRRPA